MKPCSVSWQSLIPTHGASILIYFELLESLEGLFGLPVKLVSTYALATNPYSRPIDDATKVKLYGD